LLDYAAPSKEVSGYFNNSALTLLINRQHVSQFQINIFQMPHIIVAFVTRKPGLSPSDFRSHYEKIHMPLLQSLTGSVFPLSHSRFYLQRHPSDTATSDNSNASHPPTVYVGTPNDFAYDAHCELVFENVAAWESFGARMSEPEVAAKIAEDEAKFIDRPKWKVAAVDEPVVTKRRSE